MPNQTRPQFSPFGLLALVVIVWFTQAADAQDDANTLEAKTAQTVFYVLEHEHLGVVPMASEFEPAFVNRYLVTLDPRKMYFQQADVDALRQHAQGLDRQLRGGDLTFMERALATFQRRVRQQTELAIEMLATDFDFTVDESIDLNFRTRTYCTSDEEMLNRWRKTIKYELLAGRWPGETRNQQIERLRLRYRRTQNHVDQGDREEQMELFLNVVARVFDPHNVFLSASTVDSFTW